VTRAVDVRLAVPAATAWAGAALAPALPTPVVGRTVVLTLLAGILAAGFGTARPRHSRRLLLVAAAALGLAAGCGSAALHLAALRHGPVASAAGRGGDVRLTLRVVRDPAQVHTRRGRSMEVVDATASAVVVGGERATDRAPVVLFATAPGWSTLLPGQRLEADGRLLAPRRGDLVSAAVFARGPPRLLGRPPWWQRAAGLVRERLREACAGLPGDERGLLPGLVLGDVSAMPPSLTSAFRTTGLTHLTAVSGANVGITLGAVLGLARLAGAGRRLRFAVGVLALLAFVVLVRPSPSVLRAAVMGAVVLLGSVAGRRAAPVPALAAAVLLLVLVDPFLARTPGFAMSVLATGAIVVVAPRLTDRWARRWPRPLAAALAVSASAQLACTPVIVAAFGQLCPLAVPANLLAAPAVAPATLAGIGMALLAAVVAGTAGRIAPLAAVPTAWLATVARTLAAVPGADARWPAGVHGRVLLGVATAVVTLLVVTARARRRAILNRCPP
jgi:competence protein ComEC